MRLHRHGRTDGPAVLLVHGLSSSHHSWQRNLEVLGRRHRLLVVELFSRNAGRRFQLREQAGRLATALDGETEPVAVIGHSLGGLVAMELCVQAVQLVSRLVLVDVPALPPDARLSERVRAFARRGAAADAQSIGVVMQTLIVGNPFQLAAATAVSVRSDASEAARVIKVPALLVWGRDDPIVPLETGQRLAALMRSSRIVIIDGAAHQPHREAPEAFHAAVMPFLDGN